MAGQLKVDSINADSNLALRIANTAVAYIDSTGLTIVGNSLNVGGGRIVVTSNNSISTPTVIGANLVTSTGTTALGITANGQITTANAPFILTGGGITFPATQSASSDVNTLDDYEEGTWTPTFALTSGSLTYSNQTGNYTKIGRMVTVTFNVAANTVSSAIFTQDINGLPFVGANTNFAGASMSFYGAGLFNSYCNVIGLVGSSGSAIQLRGTNSQTVAPALVFEGATITSGTQIAGTMTYFTS